MGTGNVKTAYPVFDSVNVQYLYVVNSQHIFYNPAGSRNRLQHSHYARAVCYNTGSSAFASGYFTICFHVVYCMVCRNHTYRIVFRNVLFALSD